MRTLKIPPETEFKSRIYPNSFAGSLFEKSPLFSTLFQRFFILENYSLYRVLHSCRIRDFATPACIRVYIYIYAPVDIDSHKNNRRQHVRTESLPRADNPSKIIRVGKRKEKRKEKKRKKGEALLTTATMSNARLLSNRHRRDYGHSLARIAPRRDFFNLVQLGNAYVFVVRRRRISLTVTDVSFSTSKPRRWDPRRR